MTIQPGECSRCGECCRWIIFGMAHGGADWNEYYFRHGCIIKPGVGMLVPSICPHLKRAGMLSEKVFACDIYETRPALCHFDKKTCFKHAGCTQL
jgi:hypothetical protein